MSQSITAAHRVPRGIFNLANGYPEHYEGDMGSESVAGGSRMDRLQEIANEVVRDRPKFDPNFPDFSPQNVTRFIWGDEIVPFDQRHQERKLIDRYWRMVARETMGGVQEYMKERQPIFSESATYALDLVASVLARRGINSVRLVDPCIEIFADSFTRKNGIPVTPISESELRYTGAPPATCDYQNILGEKTRWGMNAFLQLFRPKKTALVVVSPNNPTGAYIAEADLKELASFCKQNDIPLIIDSVFRAYHAKPYDDIALLEKSGCTYAVIGDTGKAAPTLLMKVGFIFCSKDWHGDIARMAEIFGEVPLTDVVLLRRSITDLHRSGFGAMLRAIDWNRKILGAVVESVKRPGLALAPCASHVPFGWITLPPGQSSSELVQNLREKDHVAVTDGAKFLNVETEVSGIRVSLARSTLYFTRAMEALHYGLERT